MPKRSQRTPGACSSSSPRTTVVRDGLRQRRCDQTRGGPEVLAFADHWISGKQAAGAGPGLLVFDPKLTTCAVLEEFSAQSIEWLTPCQRGKNELDCPAALPASAWKSARIDGGGHFRHPQLHEDAVSRQVISCPVRQITVRNIVREEPALLITADKTTGPRIFRPLHRAHARREPGFPGPAMQRMNLAIPWCDGRRIRFRFP